MEAVRLERDHPGFSDPRDRARRGQIAEISAAYEPGGPIPDVDGDGVFCSTRYLRHESVPLYTPEPDLVHEVIGHGNGLASPVMAELSRQGGLAAQRTRTPEALAVLSRVFWFSVEFGVVREGGRWRAYGAGLLSSYGELQAFDRAEIRPLDVAAMGALEYDITRYQPVLFGGESMEEVAEVVGGFFAAYLEG